jgi:hypothetical protein
MPGLFWGFFIPWDLLATTPPALRGNIVRNGGPSGPEFAPYDLQGGEKRVNAFVLHERA